MSAIMSRNKVVIYLIKTYYGKYLESSSVMTKIHIYFHRVLKTNALLEKISIYKSRGVVQMFFGT